MIWLCLLPLAQAHVPHDVLEALAAPSTLDDSVAWWSVLNFPGGALMGRSTDAGRTWQIQAADPISDALTMAVMAEIDDLKRIVVASSDALWWSDDDGGTWSRRTPDDTEITALATFDGVVYVATTGGLYTFDSTGFSAVVDGLDVSQLAASDSGVVVIDQGGGVWLRTIESTTFRSLGRYTEGAITGLAVGLDEEVGVLVGNLGGAVALWDDGDWTDCAGLPPRDSTPQVVRFGAHGDLWLAANGTRAPFVSTDRCASWASHESLDVVYSANGGAESPWQAFTSLRAGDDRWLVTGWDGLAITEDEGDTWYRPALAPVAFVRGLALAPDFAESGQAYIGAYAAGVITADAFGTEFSATNRGLADRNIQSIVVDPSDPDRLYVVAGHIYAVSTDGGANWLTIDAVGVVAEVYAYSDPSEVWVTGSTVGAGVLVSEDGIVAWSEPEGLAEAVGSSIPDAPTRVQTEEGTLTCFSAWDPGLLVCRLGADGAWEPRFDRGTERVSALLSWPPEDPTAWLIADDDGIWRSEDEGAGWSQVYVGSSDRVAYLAGADDGTLAGVSLAGHVLRSTDGGESWEDIDIQVPGGVRDLVMRPDFETYDQLLIGGPDGVYIVDDLLSSPRLRLFGGWEGTDNHVGFVECRRCAGFNGIVDLAVDYDGAWGGTVAWLATDFIAGTYLRGDRIIVRGVVPEGAAVTVTLRDASTFDLLVEEEISDMGDAVGVLGDWDDLGTTWVDVELTVTSGSVGLDFVEGWTDVEHMNGDDTGGGDGGSIDGGTEDGGGGDGGGTDGGGTDGGGTDGGSTDGGGTDGGSADGGDTGDGKDDSCGGCAAGPGPVGAMAVFLSLIAARRRER